MKHIPRRFRGIFNVTPFQCEKSLNCSAFCIYYAFHSHYNADMAMDDVLNIIFSQKKDRNEKKVLHFINNCDDY